MALSLGWILSQACIEPKSVISPKQVYYPKSNGRFGLKYKRQTRRFALLPGRFATVADSKGEAPRRFWKWKCVRKLWAPLPYASPAAVTSVSVRDLYEDVFHHEEDGEHPHGDVYFLEVSAESVDGYIADESAEDTVGDAVS